MFEAILSLCLALEDGGCRDQLLPGYEGATKAECEAVLVSEPPLLVLPQDVIAKGAPVCQTVGKPLEVEEVAPGVFVHRGDIAEPDAQNGGDVSNLGFVIGEESVAVIDAGTARWMGEALWRSIRQRTDKPVLDVILTHMHPDHILGATVFAETGARIHGHANLPRAIADRRENYLESLERLIGAQRFIGTRAPVVTDLIAEEVTLELGQRRLTLRAWSVAHTPTDLTVLDQTTGTLFTGDLIFHLHTPALDGSLLGWLAILDEIDELDLRRIVPGHGGPILDRPQGAVDTRRYLEVLAQDTRAAVADGERLGDAVTHIAKDEADNWDLFEAYNPRNATVAFTELEWE